MEYLYETHLHTKEASACSTCVGRDYIADYQKLGYQGMIVTDHFFNGNSSVPYYLPWKQKVERFCEGYEDAKRQGDQVGFDVFFGLEYNFNGDEYLIYGLEKEWLIQHPEIMSFSHKDLYETVESKGGLMIQAHPFRDREYLREIYLYPKQVHGIEVMNRGNHSNDDLLAYEYAKKYDLAMTAGSDMHHLHMMSQGTYGVSTDTKWTSIQDFIHLVKSRRGYRNIGPTEKLTTELSTKPKLPVYLKEE